MEFGGAMFFTEYSTSGPELAVVLEERGFDSIMGAGALAHFDLAQNTLPGRRRIA
jgi:hypothetical protein